MRYGNELESEHADWPDFPWLEANNARNMLFNHGNMGKRLSYYSGRGLVDECCLKPCYVEELINYCDMSQQSRL